MSNEVRIGVTGTNDSGRAVNAAKADVKALGEEAQKSAKKFVELGVSEERAAAEAGKMARKLDDVGDEAQQVARKLLEAGVASKIAAEQFARYGDKDSLDNLRKAKKEIADLSTVARNLTTGNGKSNLFDDLFKQAPVVAEKAGADAAQLFGKSFSNKIPEALKALPPEVQAALGGAILAAVVSTTPFIVSAINGAILGGIGAGGLAAGIALEAKDPVIQGAFKQLGGRIMTDLGSDVKPFKAQLLTVADDFGKSWTKIQPNIQGFFDRIAPATSKLGSAISQSMEILGPALERAAGPAEKVLGAIADEIPEIAQQLGKLLDDISEHGDSAAEAIKFIFFNVELLIGGFDLLVKSIGPVADGIVAVARGIGMIDPLPIEGTAHALDHTNESVKIAGEGMSRYGGQAEEVARNSEATAASVAYMNRQVYNTADAADQANSAFERLFGEMMSVDEADLKVAEDFRELSGALKKNKDSIDANTEGGQANRRMILGMISDLEAKREADIAAGNGTLEATRKANAAYLSQLEKLRAVAVAAGQPTAAIDKLIAKYKQLAGIPDITINVNTIHTDTYRVNGTPQAGHARYPGEEHGGIIGAVPMAAAGGMRNGLTKVGEGGWEYVELPPGSRVYPHGESMRMQAGGGGGPIMVTVALVPGSGGDAATGAYLQELQQRGVFRVYASAVMANR